MRTICIDFDGVLHSYSSGWQGADVVADPPVLGAISWLRALVNEPEIRPAIYSSRSSQTGGIKAMQEWLLNNGLCPTDLNHIEFPISKPAAFLTVDDRAVCFDGTFPTPARMLAFVPWHQKEKEEPI